MVERLLVDLIDWLAVPSVSTGEGDPADLECAAAWVVDGLRGAGGEGQVVRIDQGNPLAVGELRARDRDAPTILIYGHYDVQGPGDLRAWRSPPFSPEVRDGRLYGRGASDDKGNFLPLLHVACELASEDRLPVHVRVLVDGEEEVGGESAATWLASDERGADAAIVFDSAMADPQTPAITLGLRGMVQLHLHVRTADSSLHSGLYGGSVLNALHVLQGMLAEVLPGPDGRLRDELRAGVLAPGRDELQSWARLIGGGRVLTEAGGRPVHAGAGAEYYERNGADASLDVNMIAGGEPRTIVPATAEATLSLRLAPGQDPERMQTVMEQLLRGRLPAGAQLDLSASSAAPALFEVSEPALVLAAGALERACASAPVFVRSGGSIPIVAEMAAGGSPVIVSGFALPDDALHGPNESFRLQSLALGHRAAVELYAALAQLPPRADRPRRG